MQPQTLAITMQNKPGALARVVGVLSCQGFNIRSLCAHPAMDPRFTEAVVEIESGADEWPRDLLVRKLNKLVVVIQADDVSEAVEEEPAA